MRRFLLLLLFVVLGLAAVLLANTLRLPNHQLAAVPAAWVALRSSRACCTTT